MPQSLKHTFSSIWNDRNKIISNHGKVVPINRELLHSFRSSIDEPESVDLSRCELSRCETGSIFAGGIIPCSNKRAVEVILSIDQIVVRQWRCLNTLAVAPKKPIGTL